LSQRAAVELDEIDMIGGETAQAALDARQDRRAPPVGAGPAAGVPALREESNLPAARTDGLADQGLAVVVALRGIDHVQADIERAAEESRDRLRAHPLITDLGSTEPEYARHDLGPSEPALFHLARARRLRHGPPRYHSPVARVPRSRRPHVNAGGFP